jgi:hypothetical protein
MHASPCIGAVRIFCLGFRAHLLCLPRALAMMRDAQRTHASPSSIHFNFSFESFLDFFSAGKSCFNKQAEVLGC